MNLCLIKAGLKYKTYIFIGSVETKTKEGKK